MVELLLLEVFRRRHGLDDIAEFVEGIHDHVGAGRFQQAGIRQRDLHVNGLHALLLGLADDVLIDVRQLDGRCSSGNRCCLSRWCSRCSRCGSALCLRHIALGDLAQLLHEIGDIDEILRITIADVIDHLLQGVNAFEQDIDDVLVEFQLLFADEVEHILHLMGQLGDLVVAHRRRHALQGMCVTEDLIDDRNILCIVLQTQQAIVQRLQMLMRLVQEHVHILIGIHLYSP